MRAAAKQSSLKLPEAAQQQYLKAERGRTDELKSSAGRPSPNRSCGGCRRTDALDAETMLYAPIDGTVSKSTFNAVTWSCQRCL